MNDFVSLGTSKNPKQGYIRYIGPLIGNKYSGIYYGIELEKSNGKNDGKLDGNKYFQCKKNYGIFTKRHKIKKIIIKHKSFEYKMESLMSSFMGKTINIFPLEIYQMILFYIPPPKLYFTKDQRGISWFTIYKTKLKISTPKPEGNKNMVYGKKKKDDPRIALLRFKDNSVSANNLNVIHSTFPLRQWRHSQCNFNVFELKLSLKVFGFFSEWVVPYDSDDGQAVTQWPKFLILDAFSANEYKYKDKKIKLKHDLKKKMNFSMKSNQSWVILCGERMDNDEAGIGKWRYWVRSECGGESVKVECKNAIEIGFQFPWCHSTWICINSNVQITKQQWKFY